MSYSNLIADKIMTSNKRFSLIARNYPSFQEINPVQLNAYKYVTHSMLNNLIFSMKQNELN